MRRRLSRVEKRRGARRKKLERRDADDAFAARRHLMADIQTPTWRRVSTSALSTPVQ